MHIHLLFLLCVCCPHLLCEHVYPVLALLHPFCFSVSLPHKRVSSVPQGLKIQTLIKWSLLWEINIRDPIPALKELMVQKTTVSSSHFSDFLSFSPQARMGTSSLPVTKRICSFKALEESRQFVKFTHSPEAELQSFPADPTSL